MNEVIKFGILSFAHYHANFWVEAINDSPHAELIGIWDDDHRRGNEAATRHRTRFWPEISALLASCDAVGITSETARHADLVERAAHAGVHILLEKPMATSLAECQRIGRAVRNAGILFMQNFPKRYDPINHELVKRVQNGSLGKILLVRVRHANDHFLKLGEQVGQEWFARSELSGGGALIDEGIHAADFLLWLLGEPQSAFALTSRVAVGLPLEDTAIAIFKYPGGTMAEIVTSHAMIGAEESLEVYGTRGVAILSGVDLASKALSRPPYLKFFRYGEAGSGWQGSPTTPRFQQPDFHHGGPLYFIDCLRTGKSPVVSFEEGWKSLAMILASYQAERTGQLQELDFSPIEL